MMMEGGFLAAFFLLGFDGVSGTGIGSGGGIDGACWTIDTPPESLRPHCSWRGVGGPTKGGGGCE